MDKAGTWLRVVEPGGGSGAEVVTEEMTVISIADAIRDSGGCINTMHRPDFGETVVWLSWSQHCKQISFTISDLERQECCCEEGLANLVDTRIIEALIKEATMPRIQSQYLLGSRSN